jgi:phosphoserine phosphatase
VLVLAVSSCAPATQGPAEPSPAADPLPSWNDGGSRDRIVEFVERVTDPESADFVPESDRIATFDNDGTLWAEQPMYFQLLFSIDRIRAMAAEHPEWRRQQPFQAILENDREALSGIGMAEVAQIVFASHAGTTSEQFRGLVDDWFATARHPRYERPFDRLVYQPMLEVLDYLRANGFRVFIVSGGGVEFIRAFAPEVYGIPTDQIIGSSAETEFQLDGERASIMRLPELHFFDDEAGKPVAINRFIGKRPIAAFGNSDGDLQMLQYATGGDRPGLAVIIRHDDAEREYAYDRDSSIGHLDAALDEAALRDWTVVSMRNDWRTIFPE